MTGPIRVILADDHALVRMGFKMLLENEPDIKVVAEVDSGEKACDLIFDQSIDFDILVIDLTMQGISGIETTRRILEARPDTKILGLSAHEDPSYIRHMLHAGASAYLSKRSAPTCSLPRPMRLCDRVSYAPHKRAEVRTVTRVHRTEYRINVP